MERFMSTKQKTLERHALSQDAVDVKHTDREPLADAPRRRQPKLRLHFIADLEIDWVVMAAVACVVTALNEPSLYARLPMLLQRFARMLE